MTSPKAGDKGIHSWSLNLMFLSKPFLDLNFPRSKLALISADAAADNHFFVFLPIIQIDYQIHPFYFASI